MLVPIIGRLLDYGAELGRNGGEGGVICICILYFLYFLLLGTKQRTYGFSETALLFLDTLSFGHDTGITRFSYNNNTKIIYLMTMIMMMMTMMHTFK